MVNVQTEVCYLPSAGSGGARRRVLVSVARTIVGLGQPVNRFLASRQSGKRSFFRGIANPDKVKGTMPSATELHSAASLRRLDRAVLELEAAAAQFAERADAADRSEAELERLRALNETVGKRLDAMIARLRELLGE